MLPEKRGTGGCGRARIHTDPTLDADSRVEPVHRIITFDRSFDNVSRSTHTVDRVRMEPYRSSVPSHTEELFDGEVKASQGDRRVDPLTHRRECSAEPTCPPGRCRR
jgi:hypothetical protein